MIQRTIFTILLFALTACRESVGTSPTPPADDSAVTVETADSAVLCSFDSLSPLPLAIAGVSDSSEGGRSSFRFSTVKDTGCFGSFTFTLDKGECPWEPFVELGLASDKKRLLDCSNFEGFSYRYRGSGHTAVVPTENVTDYGYFEYQVPASTEWKTVTINFSRDLKQPLWGDETVFIPSLIQSMKWRVSGPTGTAGTLQIDDITLRKSIPEVKKNDMVRRDPETPLPLTVSAGSVTNPLHAKAVQYLNRGVNLCEWLETAGQFDGTFKYDRARIDKIASQGFTGIRLPVDLDKFVLNRSEVVMGTKPFTLDPRLFAVIDSFLIWTKQNSLSLTIDYHQYDGSLNAQSVESAGYRKMAAECWKAAASHCAGNPREDLFFELTNEPGISDDVPSSSWRTLAGEMLDSIRSMDKKHTVIFGDSRWYNAETLISSPLFAPEDGNIIYAFHYYNPQILCLGPTALKRGITIPFPYSKERWSTESSDYGLTEAVPAWIRYEFENYYRTGNKTAVRNGIVPIKNWSIENNVPVICNEFGISERHADLPDRISYFTAVTDIFTELDIPHQLWMGAFDNSGNLPAGMKEALKLK